MFHQRRMGSHPGLVLEPVCSREYARGWFGRSSLCGSRVISCQVCGLCLNSRTCTPLGRMGYGWGLRLYCLWAPLPQSMAPATSVNTLMCLCTYFCFSSEWQRS